MRGKDTISRKLWKVVPHVAKQKGIVRHYKMTLKGRGKFYEEFTPEMSEKNYFSYIPAKFCPKFTGK